MKRILILDDDQDILDVLKDALKSYNYTVHTIRSGRNLLSEISEFKPDILLLDFLLFDENGGEMCARLKNNPATAGLPVILLSGHCCISEMHSIYGCDTYLAKPFDLTELVDSIERQFNLETSEFC